MKTLGFITIGQSPRDDSVPEMEKLLGSGTRVVQAGALDGLTREEIDALAPGAVLPLSAAGSRSGDRPAAPGDPLITRLRDGASVIVAKQAILGRLQGCLDRLDPEIDAAVLLCTGVFPRFRSSHPVLEPDRILYAAAEAVFGGGRLGVLIPIEAQRATMAARWRPIDFGVAIAVASPYAGTAPLVAAAEALREAGASLIAMSCMGYTEAMKALVRDVTGVPALLPTSLVARIAAELVG
jgi:protein AroM